MKKVKKILSFIISLVLALAIISIGAIILNNIKTVNLADDYTSIYED